MAYHIDGNYCNIQPFTRRFLYSVSTSPQCALPSVQNTHCEVNISDLWISIAQRCDINFTSGITLIEIDVNSVKSSPLGPAHTKKKRERNRKNQRTILKDQRMRDKHQRRFLLSLSLSLALNGPLEMMEISGDMDSKLFSIVW